MRIAYIAGYQSNLLLHERKLKKNRTLAASKKINFMAQALFICKHDIDVFSIGPVRENSLKYYPKLVEERETPNINVYYSSAVDIPVISIIWSVFSLLFTFIKENNKKRYDLIILYNLSIPEVTCAYYALFVHKLPIILEYEDCAVVNRDGRTSIKNIIWNCYSRILVNHINGCIAPSEYLLDSVKCDYKLLLRGIFEDRRVTYAKREKKKQVVFSGTLSESKGALELVDAWKKVNVLDWTLHIVGTGPLEDIIKSKIESQDRVVFHGFITDEALFDLLSTSYICINPHRPSERPGNLFAFKIVEYLASGAHVITTPMGKVEDEIELNLTYIENYSVDSIATTIENVIVNKRYLKSDPRYVNSQYSLSAVSSKLNELLEKIIK